MQNNEEENSNTVEIPIEEFSDDPEVMSLIRNLSNKKDKLVTSGEYQIKPDTSIKKDKTFDEDTPSNDRNLANAYLSEDIKASDITQMEKDIFLKSILHDVPVELDINLFGGKIFIKLRARDVKSQKIIFDILNNHEKPQNLSDYVNRLQELGAAVMLLKFGDKDYSPPKFSGSSDNGDEEAKKNADRELLVNYTNKLVDSMPVYKWQSIVKGISLFEAKCQLMLNMCHDGNFWNPVDQEQ